jgi:hypothetical protein
MKNFVEFYCDKKFEGCIPEPQINYKNIPEWYSNTSMIKRSKCPLKFLHNNQVQKNTNVKGCPGITDFLTYGYTIPAWTNFLIRSVNNQFYINWENNSDIEYTFHEKTQFEGMNEHQVPVYDGFHKILSPWRIKTSPGISCLVTHPYWNRESRFTTVSAIMHPDVCPMFIKWFFEWNYNLSEEINYEFQTIRRGHPLIYILPFRREKYKLEIKYQNSDKFVNINNQIIYRSQDWFNETPYNKLRKSIGKLFS